MIFKGGKIFLFLNFKMRIKTKIGRNLSFKHSSMSLFPRNNYLFSDHWERIKKLCHKNIVLCESLGQLVESLT